MCYCLLEMSYTWSGITHSKTVMKQETGWPLTRGLCEPLGSIPLFSRDTSLLDLFWLVCLCVCLSNATVSCLE